MAETTRKLGLPLIAAAQAQKHVTHNEALTLLDDLVQLACLDKDLSSPPPNPSEGDRYLVVATSPTGAWAGLSGQIASFRDGAWTGLMPKPGWLAYLVDEADLYLFDGTAWVGFRSTVTTLQNLSRLGLGTTADADNPFSAKLNKALWAARALGEGGSGDLRCALNKEGAGNVLSLLWQTNFSGRAELGLLGSDDLSLKVSPDGMSWTTVLSVARATGQIAFPQGALREEITVLAASGSWAKPSWARMVTVCLMGGGGGGGSGRRGAAGSVRAGGGGGGAGALNTDEFHADELPATLTVTVGVGGAGGAAQTADTTNGTAGAVGGATSVANGASILLTAVGGGGGGGGSTAAGAAGTAGQNQSLSGVGAGAAGSVGAAAAVGGSGPQGAGGGGGGGGVSAAEAAVAGGAGGAGYLMGGITRRAASVAGGAVGLGGNSGTAKAWARGSGAGGGGGGAGPANGSGSGGAGGLGGAPGGGGGGGGGSTNGAASGAGGDGARGEVWIICRG